MTIPWMFLQNRDYVFIAFDGNGNAFCSHLTLNVQHLVHQAKIPDGDASRCQNGAGDFGMSRRETISEDW